MSDGGTGTQRRASMDDKAEPDDGPWGRLRDEGRPRRRRDEDRDEEWDDVRPRRRRRPPPDEINASDLILPGGSTYALISLYVGLLGLVLPLIGIVLAVPAFVCGVVAVRRWKSSGSYSGVTSNLRAVLGLGLSGLAILLWGGVWVVILVNTK